MLYYNSNKIIKAYKGTSIINKMDDYVSGSEPSPIPDNYVIPFEDSNVKTLCVNNWGGNVVSGELTYGEAKAVTSLGNVFKRNRNIIKFNELVYFTGLSTLDNGEFAGCTALTEIVIPSNVTYIGDVPSTPARAPFSGCSNLSGLTILSGEETLEVHMFCFNGSYWIDSAHQNTPMIFPNRSITFNDGGFAYCDYLATVYFQSITPPVNLANADISNYRKLSTVYCPIGSYDAYYAVLNPKGKTVIEYDYEADPNNVLAREREWSGKTESGTSSETKAVFQYITDGGEEPTPPTPVVGEKEVLLKLTDDSYSSVTFNSGEIYDNKFDNNINIEEVYIGSGITKIGNSAFRLCSAITTVEIGNSVTSILAYAFSGCTSLSSINIPNSVTLLEGNTFGGCTSLSSINIPNSVTSIGGATFRDCSSLISIEIPSTVTSIGSGAFRNCSGLTSVTCQSTTPPTLGSRVFDNTNNCPIYVPSGCVEDYKAASGWSKYASRIQAIHT